MGVGWTTQRHSRKQAPPPPPPRHQCDLGVRPGGGASHPVSPQGSPPPPVAVAASSQHLLTLTLTCTGSTAFKGPGTWRGDSGRGRGWQEGANLPAGAPGPWTGLQLRPNLGQRQLRGPLQEAVGVSSRAPSWRPRNPYLGSAHSCPGKRCHLRCSPHSLSNSTLDPQTSPSLGKAPFSPTLSPAPPPPPSPPLPGISFPDRHTHKDLQDSGVCGGTGAGQLTF